MWSYTYPVKNIQWRRRKVKGYVIVDNGFCAKHVGEVHEAERELEELDEAGSTPASDTIPV